MRSRASDRGWRHGHSSYSGTALGVGVGNAVITVDDTADLDAATKIHMSKTLNQRHPARLITPLFSLIASMSNA